MPCHLFESGQSVGILLTSPVALEQAVQRIARSATTANESH